MCGIHEHNRENSIHKKYLERHINKPEIFYLSELEFIQAKRHKTLTGAVPIEDFKNLRSDLNRMKVAYQIAEALDDFIKGPEADSRIWNLLLKLLHMPKGSVFHVHIAQAGLPEIAMLVAKLKKFPYISHFHLDVGPSGSLGSIFL